MTTHPRQISIFLISISDNFPNAKTWRIIKIRYTIVKAQYCIDVVPNSQSLSGYSFIGHVLRHLKNAGFHAETYWAESFVD